MTVPRFDKVPATLDFPKEETEILAFWKEQKIFEKSVEKNRANTSAKPFVFYEGPPTANGMPHNGHVLTRVSKDIFPRFQTMRGALVDRKAGWDTHGLPVEVEVEKELHIHGKAAIEAYGVEPFVRRCIDSVFRYTDEWEKLTSRIAFWVDTDDAYVTFHKSYVESVWWALSELYKRGLLYQGHKVVWWWAQGGTALSSAEVGQGYKQVDDPSAYVLFPLEGETDILKGASLLVWTTTPWTLPSNMYAAVNVSFPYVLVEGKGKRFIIAEGLREGLAKKFGEELTVLHRLSGADLVGKRYTPPFDLYAKERHDAVWRVIPADFVTLDAGTGIVHVAPAFGEDDHSAHRKLMAKTPDLPLYCAVNPDGTFVPELTAYAGRWVKDTDKDILAELKKRELLFFTETYRHDYPFCWRADSDPLIQYARPAWYIRTTQRIDEAIAQNQKIDWKPEHIKDGRFGDFLKNNVDWALSRERYWGTPLNIWQNDVSGKIETPASVDEILAKNPAAFDHFKAAKEKDPTLSEHLVVHKPWVDEVTWQNPGEEGTYRRVPDVIDCWFDSGCMPFAQWGFPHAEGSQDRFRRNFPADFISEAIDQTRGWFYSLLMVSTLLFDGDTQKRFGLSVSPPHPFKTCIVLGHITDKDGKKESKSKGNYVTPDVIYDAVRMDFAVWDRGDAVEPAPGVVFIAKEDIEGLDLQDGARINLRRPDRLDVAREVVIKAGKKLPRRVAVVAPEDREALGLSLASARDVKPVDVPFKLPDAERVRVCDDHTPAPGADAFRWFFFAASPPWNATRNSLGNVRAFQKETLIKLRNVYSFFTIYANIDGFDPAAPPPPAAALPELDRWMLSELAMATRDVTAALEAFDVYTATVHLTELVDSLSNWYVRRSRDRFWRSGTDADKTAAYATLYRSLVVASQLFAPFTPFAAEGMYKNLVAKHGLGEASVHLSRWPEASEIGAVDAELSRAMKTVRAFVSLGLQVRTAAKMRVRQPLGKATIIVPKPADVPIIEGYAALIKEELNVLELGIDFVKDATHVSYRPKPNFRTLGQRGLGKEAQELKKLMGAMKQDEADALVLELLTKNTATRAGVELTLDDVELGLETKPGFAAAGGRDGVIVLDTTLTDDLKDRGLFREVLSRVQAARKDAGLDFVDRIELWLGGSERIARVVAANVADLQSEALVSAFHAGVDGARAEVAEIDVDGEPLRIAFSRVSSSPS